MLHMSCTGIGHNHVVFNDYDHRYEIICLIYFSMVSAVMRVFDVFIDVDDKVRHYICTWTS